MNHKPKTVAFKKGVEEIARYIYISWNAITHIIMGREKVLMSDQLKSDSLPINKGSLESRICGWCEQNSDWEERWNRVLLKLENNRFMQQGYKCLQPPTLAWLFSFNKNGDYNINRIVNGEFDYNSSHSYSDGDMK